ncbi:isoprenoid synthase domain-containing protein [Suillus americanus]|nr:isoprenoid synthase domain-containing protein [Suillus americanus]
MVSKMLPQPCHLNQHYSEVKVKSAAWFKSCKAFNSANEYSDVSKPSEVCEQKNTIMDVVHNPHKPRPKREWVSGEMMRHMQSQKWFITVLDSFLEGVMQQAIDQNEHCIHDIQSYIDVRHETIAMKVLFMLLELGLDIPDEVTSHPTIETMVIASIDMIIIDNIGDFLDISYNMERARGDATHNFIMIVMHELDMDINSAMLWVADLHMEAQQSRPKWGEPIDSQMEEYCDGLGNWVCTNYEWSFESKRFFSTKGSEIQSKKCMSLMPKDCLKDSEEIEPVHLDCSLL